MNRANRCELGESRLLGSCFFSHKYPFEFSHFFASRRGEGVNQVNRPFPGLFFFSMRIAFDISQFRVLECPVLAREVLKYPIQGAAPGSYSRGNLLKHV